MQLPMQQKEAFIVVAVLVLAFVFLKGTSLTGLPTYSLYADQPPSFPPALTMAPMTEDCATYNTDSNFGHAFDTCRTCIVGALEKIYKRCETYIAAVYGRAPALTNFIVQPCNGWREGPVSYVRGSFEAKCIPV